MEYFLSNDKFVVRINSFGAEVKSVINKSTLREYMWYGDGKYWGRTSPVLFPFVGNVRDKKYNWEDIEYPMGQHGFARDMEFNLVKEVAATEVDVNPSTNAGKTSSSAGATEPVYEASVTWQLNSDETTLKKYPFPFTLNITYTLSGNELKVDWEVINPGKDTMHFSIGAHPAFLCPVHGESSKAGYKLYFDNVSEIHHHGNTRDTGLAIMSEDILMPLNNGRVTITEDFFDRCTYMIEGNQTGLVGIEDPDGNRYVDVIFNTPLFAIWSPEGKNAPFLCIEPWYGRADATDFTGDISQREYNNSLAPSARFNGGYSMKFY